ncbi:Fpg/Nei family DNA glycosylase [Allonocardiopsis opalescens]|uniref:Formamidopyrimidine-DNA glycosylase n=1 Tax=Allonocardiopsis opalescens TaxID=1144618 RepID=A0A2T0Q0G9_9ACTN|nr:DNA-formamidopyrimidine glycosylase family protein [Allonocardiopsis opalescens]PRX97291.1 formamidopyrimidine-DNA glycosylase [Allonocardiopsis opalescens]
MPELPEVEALAELLRRRAVGRTVAGVDVAAFPALKTVDPPVGALGGLAVTGAGRHGKFLDLECDGLHLVVHLAKGGWLRWRDDLSDARPPRPGKGPPAARVRFAPGDDGRAPGFDLTETGSVKRLALYVVRAPEEVPGVAGLGPDPLAEDFTEQVLAAILRGRRSRIKRLLRDQHTIAGIGNAYSDEVLHAARISPFAVAATLDERRVGELYRAMRETLGEAVRRALAADAGGLKREKRAGMRVHGRAGQPCPVCGDTVREVVYADSALQYCPTCQTGGAVLADRRMSRLLK